MTSTKKQNKKDSKPTVVRAASAQQVALAPVPAPTSTEPKKMRAGGGADALLMAAFCAFADGGDVAAAIVRVLGQIGDREQRKAIERAAARCPSGKVRTELRGALEALPKAREKGVVTMRAYQNGTPYLAISLPKSDARFQPGALYTRAVLEDGSIVLTPVA